MMETTENPYASPSAAAIQGEPPIQAVRRSLLIPAIGILSTSILLLLAVAAAVVMNIVMYFAGYPEVLDLMLAIPIFAWIFYALILTSSAIAMVGAIAMLRGKQYRACLAGAIVASIPILSPCYVLGIPFGIWALVILLRKDTRTAFAEV